MKTAKVENWIVIGLVGTVVFLAEWLLMQQQIVQGVLLYSVLLILLLLYSTFRWPRPQHQLLVLTNPTIIRLMAYTLPLGELSPIFAQLVISVPLGITAVVFIWLLEQELPDLHLEWQQAPYYLLLVTIGAVAGLILYQFQQSSSPMWRDPLLLLFYSFVLLVTTFLEEWLFRGIMQTALTRLWGNSFLAGMIVAFFYTILSLGQGEWPFILLIFFLSLILSWLQHFRNHLIFPWLVHGTLNLFFFLILPLVASINI